VTTLFRRYSQDNQCVRVTTSLLSVLLLLLVIATLGPRTLAQERAPDWATPVNLSLSGTASNPAIVRVPGGALRIFWWDPFDGTMVVDGVLMPPAAGEAEEPATPSPARDAWPAPIRATIRLSETAEIEGEAVTVRTPIQTAPRIVGDASGRAHAFWLGEPDEESGDTPLLYSRLNPGSTGWSVPSSLASSAGSFAATADNTGSMHLVYIRTEATPGSPVGLHYRRLPAGGFSWGTPVDVHLSRYLRLLSPEGDALRLSADSEGTLYATWEGPDRGQILLARSADRGTTWSEPEEYLGSGIQPGQDLVIGLPGSPSAVLWAPAGEPDRRIAASAAGSALNLAAWDGVRWLETAEQLLYLEDPESGKPVRLYDLRLALVPPSANEEAGVETLAVTGLDDSGDLWITGVRVTALEQLLSRPAIPGGPSGAGVPAPVNLSTSGAASDPAILAPSGDRLYAFWEDQFDGLTVADALVVASTVLSGTQEITTTREIWSEPRAFPLLLPEPEDATAGGATYAPVDGVPRMVGDASGRLHAFWSAEPAAGTTAGEVATRPLMYSRLAQDASAWSSPAELAGSTAAFDVAADSSGALHLVTIEMRDTPSSPAGVYYRRLEQGRIHWTAPLALQQSRTFRLLTPETAHLRLAADEMGAVYVTWDDPQQGGLVLAHSTDSGMTWQEPTAIGNPEENPRRGRIVSVPQGDTLLLWEGAGSVGSCSLFQATVLEALEGGSGAGRLVLEGLGACPDGERFLPLGESQVLMILGSGTDALTLAVWDGSPAVAQWSEPSRLSFSFEDPASVRQVYVGNLQVAVVDMPADAVEGLSGRALVAAGTDQDGDVWATSSQAGALDVVFAAPSPWSPVVKVSLSEGHPDLPAVATDGEGRVHALWAEAAPGATSAAGLMYARRDGEAWTGPAQVLASPESGSTEPELVAQGDRLHAIWSSQDGKILYSSAFAEDAYTAGGWSEPRVLSEVGSTAGEPDLVADAAGGLHAVFAVPINEGRGIYYTRSADGQTWTPPVQVFDAAGAGWIATAQPQLAVDGYGFLHVAWVRTLLPGSQLPDGIYYARSLDVGQSWSEPQDVAIGEYAWPQISAAAEGRVHLVWQEANGQDTWWHRYSSDAGETWTGMERIAGLEGAGAPVRLLADADRALHLVGLGADGKGLPTLLHATWDGSRWSRPEAFRIEVKSVEAGVSAAMSPVGRRLDLLFRSEDWGEDNTAWVGLWHTDRELPAVVVAPAPAFVPPVAATPPATPSPAPSATPPPNFSAASPAAGGDDLLLPILLASGGALLIVGAAAGARVVGARRR
jgi:hypothetical protein